MNKLKVTAVSALKVEKARKDGKVSRQYFTVTVVDAANPLVGAQRNIFQDHSKDGKTAFWKRGITNTAFSIGQELEGSIERSEVEGYDVDGSIRNSYTCMLLKGEYLPAILKQAGHFLPGQKPVAKTDAQKALID